MVRTPRSARFALFLLSVAPLPLLAQSQPAPAAAPASPQAPAVAVDRSPWLYKGSDIPQDPAWHFGTLPNGLRYAVRNNQVPPGQVSIRVRVDAGSLMETDDQAGYAHLIEHLTFRGSEYVPDGEAKRVWQRLGATFGSDTNANTTATQTVYKLDLPGANESSIDQSLHILSGMVAKPAITDQGLAAERPAVLAEQREAPGPQVRWSDKLQQTMFAGQPLADRSPIGHVKELEAATPASVRAFHDKWYRPERTVVIVSGDVDAAMVERLIVKNFAAFEGVGPKPAEPDFGKPSATAATTAALAEAGLPPMITYAVLRPWKFNADTIIFNQNRFVDTIAAAVISRRLETRARTGGSFLQAQVNVDDVSRSANATIVNVVPVGADWKAALKDVRAVIADALAHPPSQAEIDRELADYDTGLRTAVETRRVEPDGAQADIMAQALDIRETTTSAEASYGIFVDARKKSFFTPARVLASTRKIFTGVATRAIVNTQTPDPEAPRELAMALKADVSKLATTRAQQGDVKWTDLPAPGAAGTVVARQTITGLDMESVTFSNGAKLLVFPNPGETGRVYVRVGFGGGYNALPADQPGPIWAADLALVQGGIGKLNQGDLEALTQGRRINIDFDIDDDSFDYSATTSPADFADEMKLLGGAMAAPGWDPAPVARAKAAMMATFSGMASSPDGVMQRDLEGLLRDGDPRWTTPTPEQVQALTPEAFKAFWAPRLAAGPIEVQVFGDVTTDQAIAAVGSTIGALPPRPPVSPAVPPVRFPAHVAQPVERTHSGEKDQALAVIAWPTGGGSADLATSRKLEVLSQIFSDRLFDRLRSEAGVSYSPQVASTWPVGLPSGGRIYAIGKVPPDKTGLFFKLARDIAADLVANPVSADEFARTMTPMKQSLLRASTGNQFWLRLTQGGSFDERRIEGARTIGRDIASVTPAVIQALAARYLRPDTDWTFDVVPAAK